MEKLLDKSSMRKLNLMEILERSNELSISKVSLLEAMDVSEFICTQTIEDLRMDFEEFGLVKYFKIEEDGHNVLLFESEQGTSELLKAVYIRQSLKYKLLIALHTSTKFNIQSFCEDNFISNSFFYKVLKSVKEYLKDFDIEISKQFEFVGKEIDIRRLLYLLLTDTSKVDFVIYPTYILDKSEAMLKMMSERLSQPLSVIERVRLKHYICLMLQRVQRTDYENMDIEKLTIFNEESDIWQFVMAMVKEQVKIDGLAAKVETTIIMSLLLEWDCLSYEGRIVKEDSSFHKLSNSFLNYFQTYFETIDIDPVSYDKMATELSCTLFNTYLFAPSNVWKNKVHDITYFEELYPEFVYLCRAYIGDNSLNRVWEYRNYLFYNFLLILVKYVSLDSVVDPVVLCIDFSAGKNYMAFIKKNLAVLHTVDLKIVDSYTTDTDIVLTDYPSMYQEVENKVVWLTSPRAADWANLATKIVEVRGNRFKEAHV